MASELQIAQDVLLETERFLRNRGKRGKEGLVLWAGIRSGRCTAVFHCVKAGGRWSDGVRLEFRQMLRLTRHLSAHGLLLLAQVHNHPDRIPHSLGDDLNPASHMPGYLSIVVPDMGLDGIMLSDCYVYEYLGQLRWRELDLRERVDNFKVLPRTLRLQ